MDIENNISTLQFIYSTGNKRFLKNGVKGGCFYPIGEFKDCNGKILLCEGYATCASIYMATGELTICCFDAGNLLLVAVNIKKLYPNAEIIICADNDKFNGENTGRNTGLEAGKVVANAINAVVVYPIFKNPKDKPSDFNDLHCLEGIDAVREQISGAYGVRYG